MTIGAVIFDMDGLLLDSEVYWEQARRGFCQSRGCDWTSQDEDSVKGYNSPEWAAKIKSHCRLDTDPGEIIREVSDRMTALYHEHLPLLPGAVEIVRDLALRYPLGLASSSPPQIIAYALREAGILDCFKAVVSADDVGRGKPNPDVFLVTAERLGVPATQVAVFEDSTAGIRAGRAADMFVIAVPNPHNPPSAEALGLADVVMRSLSEFSPTLFP
jgi:HAD superfamily hydrolase (TIGR01509 family)